MQTHKDLFTALVADAVAVYFVCEREMLEDSERMGE
jgi:hypothetical protein